MAVTTQLIYPQGFTAHPNGDNRNTSSSGGPPIVSVDRSGATYQMAAFYNKDGRLTFARRQLDPDTARQTWVPSAIETASTGTEGGTQQDGHNSVALGIDPSGVLHVAYDHHVVPLNYRRSSQPIESFDGTFTAEQTMVNSAVEQAVTYPRFFTDPGGDIYFLFRDGGSGNGDWRFYAWDDASGSWSAATGTGTDGLMIDGKASSVNPYGATPPAFDPDFGSGGWLHFFWTWRGGTDSTTNHDVLYVRWDGTSWQAFDGTIQTMPVTEANVVDTVETVAEGEINEPRGGAVVDSTDAPIFVNTRDDAGGQPQSWVYYRSAGAWASTQATDLAAGDNDSRRFVRANLMIDKSTGVAYVVREVDDVLVAWESDPGDYSTWTRIGAIYQPSGDAKEISMYDLSRWQAAGEMQVMTQKAAA